MKKILLSVFLLIQVSGTVSAQCAMCRSTLENNFSNGQPGIAAGMNIGILYLLFLPYLAAMVIGYMWYKSSRNGGKEFTRRTA